MSDFNDTFARLVARDDDDAMRLFINQMRSQLRTCTDEEHKILVRRIRILKDYLKDDEESERDI